MLLGCIADDLTGATDLAVTLAREGLSVIQVNGVPEKELIIPERDSVVVALKSRTIPREDAVAQSLGVLSWLRDRGAKRIFFKYCSTFDSTPRGNIGPVADALLQALGGGLTVTTPAYPRNQRTVYLGHLFVGEDLLSDSTMRHHPLTPMMDSNLLRVMGQQTEGRVGLVPYSVMERGVAAIRERLARLQGSGYRYAILDAVTDAHLILAGEACLDMALTTGGAGLGMGIAHALVASGWARRTGETVTFPVIHGPSVILSGSCSGATLAQVAAVSGKYPSLRLDPFRLAEGPEALEAAGAWALERLGSTPILFYSSAPHEDVAQARERLGQEQAAQIVENAFSVLAVRLARAGVRRFVVAGGETAGAVIETLGVKALAIGPEIAPGVPWTATTGEPVLMLALKSGNFGQEDFFIRAFEVLK